jgi:ABC-type lipoprotein release transport system permease subunit
MIPNDTHTVAAYAVAGVFLYLGTFGLALKSAMVLQLPLSISVLLGIFSPLSSPVLCVMAALRPNPAVEARGGGFFKKGADGVIHPLGLLLALLVAGVAIVGTFAAWRFGFDVKGEQLQVPIVRAVLVGGLLAGFIAAALSKRVAFLEAIFVTGLLSLVAARGGVFVGDLFTYGTAAAYYAVVLVAAALILLLALTLGGSFGFLFLGDGRATWSWSYEQWIGRRFLMGKRSNNVVGIITVISVLAVGVGTMAMIVVMSVMNGFSTDLRGKIFGANAHLLVLKYGTDFTEYESVVEKTRTVPHVTGASPFVLNEVMISSEQNLTGALLKGIDTRTVDDVSVLRQNVTKGDLEHLPHPEKITVPTTAKPATPGAGAGAKDQGDTGAFDEKASEKDTLAEAIALAAQETPSKPAMTGAGKPKEAAKEVDDATAALDEALALAAAGTPSDPALVGSAKPIPGIAIGQEMARNLKVTLGDIVNVVSPVGELGPTGPVPKARAFRIAAIFFSGMYEYDSKFVYIHLGEAQDFFTLKGGVTGIEYKVDDIELTQGISREILQRIGGYPYRTKDWMEMNKNLFSALKLEKIAMFIILTFIILIASFLIAATLIVFVIEKSKEIAILKSMGASDTSIMKVFVTYGVTVGTVGSLSGLIVGLAVCFAIKTFGIGLDPDVYYITDLPVHVDTFESILVGTSAIVLSYLATIYPSLLAARLRPVEGLRFE